MRQTRNPAATLAALAVLTMLTSCSNDDTPAATGSSPTGDGSATPTPERDYSLVGDTALTGPGRWAMQAAGDPEAPLAVFDVPAGYQGRETFVWTHDDLYLDELPGQLLYEAPTRVFADPCDTDRPSPRVGPTVEDLTRALVAQRRTATTRPATVTLDGHDGLYLELSTPPDVRDCSEEGGMVVFGAGRGHARVLEFPTTDRYWILDVDGHRVVVAATTPLGARAQSVERVTDVAEAITFVDASDSSAG